MNTVMIPVKEYKQSIKLQRSILSRLDLLQKVFFESSKDEIDPIKLKHFEKISLDLDKGKGKKFSSFSPFKNYLRSL